MVESVALGEHEGEVGTYLRIALLGDVEVEFGIDEFVHRGVETHVEDGACVSSVARCECELHL